MRPLIERLREVALESHGNHEAMGEALLGEGFLHEHTDLGVEMRAATTILSGLIAPLAAHNKNEFRKMLGAALLIAVVLNDLDAEEKAGK